MLRFPNLYCFSLVVIILGSFLLESGTAQTFTNPIFEGASPDPAVHRVGDFYYLTLSTDSARSLTIYKSPVLTDFRNVESKVIFRCPEGYSDLWASELHTIRGQLYIYFTFQGGGATHRMYVIQAENPEDPMGNWGDAIKIDLLDPEIGGIDGTILEQADGRLYMAWSSQANLFITRMINATASEPSAEKIRLRVPEAEWECLGMNGRLCMSEGPYFIYNQGVAYLIFSASETMSPHYCLGMMSIDMDKDPLNTTNWWYGPDGPVFWRNDEEEVYTTGHAAFTVSPDGTETWMTYHATDSTINIGGNRVARIEKIEWAEDGKPVFPRPHGYNHPQPVPSGQ